MIVSLLLPFPRLPSLASTPKKAILNTPVYLLLSWLSSSCTSFSFTSSLTAMFSSFSSTFSTPFSLSVACNVKYRITAATIKTRISKINNGIFFIHFFLSMFLSTLFILLFQPIRTKLSYILPYLCGFEYLFYFYALVLRLIVTKA